MIKQVDQGDRLPSLAEDLVNTTPATSIRATRRRIIDLSGRGKLQKPALAGVTPAASCGGRRMIRGDIVALLALAFLALIVGGWL